MKSNCIIFALQRWFSLGGYIVLRKSNYGWWPHMIWTKDLATFEEFTPPVHQARAFPPLVFNGIVKRTNREEQVAMGRLGLAAAAIARRATDLTLPVRTACHTPTKANDMLVRASEIMATRLYIAAPLVAGTARRRTPVGDALIAGVRSRPNNGIGVTACKSKPGADSQKLSKAEWLKVSRSETVYRFAGRSGHGNLHVYGYRSRRDRNRRLRRSPRIGFPVRPATYTVAQAAKSRRNRNTKFLLLRGHRSGISGLLVRSQESAN